MMRSTSSDLEVTLGKSSSESSLKCPPTLTCGFVDFENRDAAKTFALQYSLKNKTRIGLFAASKTKLDVHPDHSILDYKDCTVYRSDLDNLNEGEWFNDNNIMFVYEYLESLLLGKRDDRASIVLLRPSMAFLLLHANENPHDLLNVLPSFEKAKFIFMPINDNEDVDKPAGGAHWSLVVACVKSRKAYHYDTCSGKNNLVASKTVLNLFDVLDAHWTNKHSLPAMLHKHHHRLRKERLPDMVSSQAPQQNNSNDCGVLVCEMTCFLLRRLTRAKTESVSLSLKNVEFLADIGRQYILFIILELLEGSDRLISL